MLQTGITIGIIAGSALLLAYWFRYTCLLLLTTRTARDYASSFAKANQLSFLQVQAELEAHPQPDIPALTTSLDRDFAAISQWNADLGLEDKMLQLDYRAKRLFIKLAGSVSPLAVKQALNEMSLIVSHLANSVGEQQCDAEGAA